MTPIWSAEPTAGDVVWCRFPDDSPQPKPRPALVLEVLHDDAPQYHVLVIHGTSQRTTQLHRGEFVIQASKNPAAYAAAGLSYDTKFDMKQRLELPYNSLWFDVPPASPYGQCPKLGILHPSMVVVAAAAHGGAIG